MLSAIPSVVALGLVALVALRLSQHRSSPPEHAQERSAAGRALVVATVVQGVHFGEEAATGLHERLGAVFGLPGMPFFLFVTFNICWLGIWIVSVRGVRAGRPAALFAAWFLAIAGMFNGIAHPLLAIRTEGYFPGIVTSPLIGVVSLWLWLRLRSATRPRKVLGA